MAAKGVIKITKSAGFLYVNHKGGVMRVFVTGVKGQLGYDVMNELEKQGLEGIGVDIDEMDITDADQVNKVIKEAAPDAVIHCAAYTAVDAAEDNEEICRKD